MSLATGMTLWYGVQLFMCEPSNVTNMANVWLTKQTKNCVKSQKYKKCVKKEYIPKKIRTLYFDT